MLRLSKFLVFGGLILSAAWSQQSYPFFSPSPAPPLLVTATANSPFGQSSYCYWVVVVYPIGKSTPSAPSCVPNAIETSSVLISWSAASGASSYDVLRTTTPILPNVTSSIAVATAVSGTTQTDSFGALSSYAISSAVPATANLYLDNTAFSSPQLRAIITGVGGTSAFNLAAATTPGGSNGQVQYNNAGVLGGFTVSGDATLNTGTGALTLATSVVKNNQANTYTGGGAQNFGTDNLTTTGVASVGSLTVTGANGIIRPGADATNAIQIQNVSGPTAVVDVDTTNSRVGIGTTSPGATLDARGTGYFGTNTFTKAALPNGSIALDNGSGSPTAGVHWYGANNTNWGIDNNGGVMRIVHNLDESGGFVLINLNPNTGRFQLQAPSNGDTFMELVKGGAGTFDISSTVLSGHNAISFTDTSNFLFVMQATSGNVGVGGVTNPTAKLQIGGGLLYTSGTTPTIANNACGSTTQGTLTGATDADGLVTVGTAGVTTCTVSFSQTYTQAPRGCQLTPANATAAAQGTTLMRVSSITTSQWVITGSALDSAAFYYHCQ